MEKNQKEEQISELCELTRWGGRLGSTEHCTHSSPWRWGGRLSSMEHPQFTLEVGRQAGQHGAPAVHPG